ncbi:hypothetical protein [Microbispora siamensis]|nr:hypothetical protein [Microbispora siamensis]
MTTARAEKEARHSLRLPRRPERGIRAGRTEGTVKPSAALSDTPLTWVTLAIRRVTDRAKILLDPKWATMFACNCDHFHTDGGNMGVIAEAVTRVSKSPNRRSDIATSPLPLGVPFGVPLSTTEVRKDRPSVFGLSLSRPFAEVIEGLELEYNDELQLALESLAGPWDGSILPRMVTVAGSIEQTPATGTLIVSTGNQVCPDSDKDTDATDRDRD